MSAFRKVAAGLLAVVFVGLVACGGGGGGGGGDETPTGKLKVTVTEAGAAAAISGARVAVINGSTGNVIQVLTTDANGVATATLNTGQVMLEVSAQGYHSSPLTTRLQPLPFAIGADQTTSADVELSAQADPASLGSISGTVRDAAGKLVANALVVSDDGVNWLSTATDADGHYVLFNVPAGTAQVTAYRAGHNFPAANLSVTAGADTVANIAATSKANGTVTGRVSFLAAQNSDVDVTLVHPGTGLVLPGLTTRTSGGDYTLTGVPNGTFDAVASLATDGYVLDPDSLVKFGTPSVTMSGTPLSLDFDVTDAFSLRQPRNHPVVAINAITFQWYTYPQTKDYVLEVIDESGNVVWGGHQPGANNYTVPSTAGKAGSDANGSYYALAMPEPGLLQVGSTYRVRVYASVDQNTAPFYKLISMTEDLEGVFTVGAAK